MARSPKGVQHCHPHLHEEESIYHVGAVAGAPAAPQIKVYSNLPFIDKRDISPRQLMRQHNNSSQINNIFNPIMGPRDALIRQGKQPMDHSKANRLKVHEASEINNLRKAQEAMDSVEVLLNGHQQPRKPPPPQVQAAKCNPGPNFLAKNRAEASKAAPKHKRHDKTDYLAKPEYGKVPQYLVERNIRRDLERERALEAAGMPPGMRLMPESERLETLAMLKENRAEMVKALQSMPFHVETPGQKRRKMEFETRIDEIEKALSIFSKVKVLVQA